MSPLGNSGNLSTQTSPSVPSEHATSIIDTTHIFNPCTNKCKKRTIATKTTPPPLKQTFLRTPETIHCMAFPRI